MSAYGCVWVCQQIQNVQSRGRKTELTCHYNKQGYTNPRHKITTVTTFCTVVPNACGSSAWILFQVILLALRIVTCLLIFLTGEQLPFHSTSLKLNAGVSTPICYNAEKIMDTSNTKQCVTTGKVFNVFFC